MTRRTLTPADRAADRLGREQRAVDRAKAAVERALAETQAAVQVVRDKQKIADERQVGWQLAQEVLAAAEARRDHAAKSPDLARGEGADDA